MVHVNVVGLLTCLIRISNEEVMLVQTLAIMGATSKPLLYQGVVVMHLSMRSVQNTMGTRGTLE